MSIAFEVFSDDEVSTEVDLLVEDGLFILGDNLVAIDIEVVVSSELKSVSNVVQATLFKEAHGNVSIVDKKKLLWCSTYLEGIAGLLVAKGYLHDVLFYNITYSDIDFSPRFNQL